MSFSNLHIRNLVIVGVGLIGGSLALSLKKAGIVDQIIGVGRNPVNLRRALALGAIDEISDNIAQAVENADIVLLATPVNTITVLLKEIAPFLGDETIVTDVGSVKGRIVKSAKEHLGIHYPHFVAGHPVAGKEKSGIEAASADLFDNHKVVLTPDNDTDQTAQETVRKMWEAAGASVETMNMEEHDQTLSITSHLPHVLAYVMMDFLADADDPDRCYEMAAGGFYDFTRTASSDPEMWRDISIMNGERIVKDIRKFQARLEGVALMIQYLDSVGIEKLYSSARTARDMVTKKSKSC